MITAMVVMTDGGDGDGDDGGGEGVEERLEDFGFGSWVLCGEEDEVIDGREAVFRGVGGVELGG